MPFNQNTIVLFLLQFQSHCSVGFSLDSVYMNHFHIIYVNHFNITGLIKMAHFD